MQIFHKNLSINPREEDEEEEGEKEGSTIKYARLEGRGELQMEGEEGGCASWWEK